MPTFRHRLPGLPVLVVFAAMSLHGADLTWDGSTSTPGLQDDAGAWNTTDLNRWYNTTTSAYQVWSNAVPDFAIFGAGSGAAGSVSLATPITASGLRFDAAGSGAYTLTGSTLTLAGTPVVTANVDATLSSILAGTSGMTKEGAGNLKLAGSASNTLTGTTTINAGTLTLSKTGGALAIAGNIQVNTGGTLFWDVAGTQVAPTTNITVAGGTIDFGNRSPTFVSYTQTAGGQMNSNIGTVTITGTLAMSGGRVLTLNSAGQWSAGTVDFTGFTTGANALLLASDGQAVVTRFTVGTGGLTMSGQNIILNRATVAGRLGNELVLNGDVTASGTNSISYGSAVVKADGAVNQVSMSGVTRTWAITAGTTTVNLAIVGTAGLTKTGEGTLTLAGIDASTYAGITTVNGGTLSLGKAAGVNAVGGDITVSSGTLKWDQNDQVPDTATITVNGGLTLNLGAKNETFASYIQTAGIGFSSASGNSGMVTVTGLTRVSGGGAININSGGQMTLYQADFTGHSGTAINLGGNSTTRITSMTIGAGGLTLSGQVISMTQGTTTGGANNALGGELVLQGPITATGSNAITYTAAAYGVAQVNLGSEARTFNIVSGSTSVSPPMVGSGGIVKSGAGTLTLSNASTYSGKTTVSQGTLTLGAAGSIANSSWVQIDSGATFNTSAVSGGYALSGSTVLSGGGSITGSLQVGGTAQLRPGPTSDTAAVAAAGNGAGTLAISGALTFTPASSTTVARFQIFSSTSADKITVGGNLVLNASSNMAVTFDGNYTPAWKDSWELIDWTGVLTEGGFSTGTNLRTGADGPAEGNLNLPDLSATGWVWEISQFSGSGSLVITVVPEPSRLVFLALGAAFLLQRRLRRGTV